MTQKMQHFSLKVLTINIHKGFTAFNRRFILPELRDAVRTVSADIVCLQEVMGAHEVHPHALSRTGPTRRTMNFWPTPCGVITPTAATRSIRKAITATRCCRVILSNIMKTATFPSGRAKNAGCFTAALHRPLDLPIHVGCVHLGLREVHRQAQLKDAGRMGQCAA